MELSDINPPFFQINYCFSSYLNDELYAEPGSFVQKIVAEVYEEDVEESDSVLASSEISIIQFQLAIDYKYPLIDVMDASEAIMLLSEALVIFDEKDTIEKIGDFDTIDLKGKLNILFLENVEIESEWSALGIEKMLIKNLAEQFYSSCGVIVIQDYLSTEMAADNIDFDLYDIGFKRYSEDYYLATPTEILRKMSSEFPL